MGALIYSLVHDYLEVDKETDRSYGLREEDQEELEQTQSLWVENAEMECYCEVESHCGDEDLQKTICGTLES